MEKAKSPVMLAKDQLREAGNRKAVGRFGAAHFFFHFHKAKAEDVAAYLEKRARKIDDKANGIGTGIFRCVSYSNSEVVMSVGNPLKGYGYECVGTDEKREARKNALFAKAADCSAASCLLSRDEAGRIEKRADYYGFLGELVKAARRYLAAAKVRDGNRNREGALADMQMAYDVLLDHEGNSRRVSALDSYMQRFRAGLRGGKENVPVTAKL
ncbi:Uncharacterised protein [uncultured archaeon]|nr:Uncharacterised protein [uncultured archaeon]